MNSKKATVLPEGFRWEDHDEPGNCTASRLGMTHEGSIASVEYACQIPDCKCKGYWYSGNSKEADYWIQRGT